MNKTGEREDGKGDEMESGQDFREPFIIAGEASEAGEPSDRALDHLAFGQQDEAAFVGWALDQNKLNSLRSGILDGLLTGVAFSSEDDFNLTAGDPLHPFDQFRNLRMNGTSPQASCALAGVTYAASKWPSVSTARCTLRPRPVRIIQCSPLNISRKS